MACPRYHLVATAKRASPPTRSRRVPSPESKGAENPAEARAWRLLVGSPRSLSGEGDLWREPSNPPERGCTSKSAQVGSPQRRGIGRLGGRSAGDNPGGAGCGQGRGRPASERAHPNLRLCECHEIQQQNRLFSRMEVCAYPAGDAHGPPRGSSMVAAGGGAGGVDQKEPWIWLVIKASESMSASHRAHRVGVAICCAAVHLTVANANSEPSSATVFMSKL
jgi:hypothetical protein